MRRSYSTSVDSDVKYSPTKFAEEIAIYLADPDGWTSRGITFFAVKKNPSIHIRLVSPKTMGTLHCQNSQLSCAEMNGNHVYLNSERWKHGSEKSMLKLFDYRQYVVTHELGHILGYEHVKCPGRGQPAPLMMQQTLGIGECLPNTKITKHDG